MNTLYHLFSKMVGRVADGCPTACVKLGRKVVEMTTPEND